MKGYKAFKPGMICKNKKYEENSIATEEKAFPCKTGIHFCKNPMDVLKYYPLVDENGNFSEFAEVESIDDPLTDDNIKYCTTKLKIGAKLSFAGFINACVEYAKESTVQNSSSGDYARIGSIGDYAQIGSSGDSARIGSSGYSAQIGSSGDYAQIGSSGDYARINSAGEYSVVMCAGVESIAKAKKGSWITLSEWKYDNAKQRNIPVCVKTEQVDGDRIREDVFYKLENGEFVEADAGEEGEEK